jgi:hypothetical protein
MRSDFFEEQITNCYSLFNICIRTQTTELGYDKLTKLFIIDDVGMNIKLKAVKKQRRVILN